MDEVVSPVLHNNVPVNDPAVNTELPQLFVTVTVGVDGFGVTVNVAGLEFAVPAIFVHTARYCLLLSPVATANVRVVFVAPLISVQTVPFVLTCHCTVGVGMPVAAEVKVTLFAAQIVCETGCVVTDGGML